MAATDPQADLRPRSGTPRAPAATSTRGIGSVLAAALALPGLAAPVARAESPPEDASLAFKYLHYEDSQRGLQRITVDAPSVYAITPIGQHWSVEGSAVVDAVSGASPRYYSTVSGASKMDDTRVAQDAQVTYYGWRHSLSASVSHSKEHDYESLAGGLQARISDRHNNTTFNLGVGGSSDTIDPTNGIVSNESKKTWNAIAGLTQAMTPHDLAQVQLGHSSGRGYFNDPYKLFDVRPDTRRQDTLLLRWNHQFERWDSTARWSYRYYRDSWDIRAHTIDFEFEQPLGERFSLTPGLRYYTQSAARFYIDPPDGDQNQLPLTADGSESSLDQRLSAFGGITGSLALRWRPSGHWQTDLKASYHQERGDWRLTGTGSPGLTPFEYTAVELGVAYRF